MTEPRTDFEAQHTEEGFGEYTAGHLAGAEDTVDEDDRYFLDAEAALVSRKLHFNLEGVSLEANLVQFDGFEYFAAIAHESGGRVVNGYAENGADVLGGEVTHQDASHRPVDDVHAADVATTDSHVGVLFGEGLVEFEQVLGIVAEVGIHLEDIVVAVLQPPSETADIGCTESEFTLPLDKEETVSELALHQVLDDSGRSVGRAVVNDEDMERHRQRKDGARDGFDVLFFVVGGDDY